MLEYFWPIVTGYTFLDVWTLPHLGFWCVIGSIIWALKGSKWLGVEICFLLALLWETFEYFIAFPLWPNHWLDPESWINSLISDPLTCIIGYLGIWWLLEHRIRRNGS
jgi:hypothetical protein